MPGQPTVRGNACTRGSVVYVCTVSPCGTVGGLDGRRNMKGWRYEC